MIYLTAVLAAFVLVDILLRVYELWLFRRYKAEIERSNQPIYIPPPIIWKWGAGNLVRWPTKEKKRKPI